MKKQQWNNSANVYCVSCKMPQTLTQPRTIDVQKADAIIKGACPACGTILYKRINKG